MRQHLANLGLAGPTAPSSGMLPHSPALPFHALGVLPAELLAIPIPVSIWAFEDSPTMSFQEWESTDVEAPPLSFSCPVIMMRGCCISSLLTYNRWVSGLWGFPSWCGFLFCSLHSSSQVPRSANSPSNAPLHRLHTCRRRLAPWFLDRQLLVTHFCQGSDCCDGAAPYCSHQRV